MSSRNWRKNKNSAWQYKKKFAPDHVLAEWGRICGLPAGNGKNELKRKMIEEATAIPGKSFDSDFSEKFRALTQKTTGGAIGLGCLGQNSAMKKVKLSRSR